MKKLIFLVVILFVAGCAPFTEIDIYDGRSYEINQPIETSTGSVMIFVSNYGNPLGAVAAFLYALMIPVTGLTNLALLVYCFDVLYVIEKRFNIRSTWCTTSATFFFGLFYVQYRINRLTIQG